MTKESTKSWLRINSKPVDLAQISPNKDDFEGPIRDFCIQWQSGQTLFPQATSGSTGLPTTIVLHRAQMVASAQATAKALQLSPPLRALLCLNTAYIGGKMMLVRAMEGGWMLEVVAPTGQPFRALQKVYQWPEEVVLPSLQALGLEFAALVPLQLQNILDDPLDFRPALNQMRALIVGGAPVSPPLEQACQSLSVPVYSTYGMTETVSHIALRRLNASPPQPYFETLPGIEIQTNADDCLCIKGAVTRHEWLVTHDQVELLSPRRFLWLGRADHVINSGGIKIFPEKLESVISAAWAQLGPVPPFFVAGWPDDTLGQQVILVVEGPALTPQAKESLQILLTKTLSRYEIPKKIVTLKRFERTPTEKIRRKATLNLINNLTA
ncbi:MAG: AMP-binding protein [Microscillaceae bacterium]